MKAKAIMGRGRALLVIAPIVLIIAMLFAFSGPFNGAASAQYGGGDPYDPCWGENGAIYSPFGINPETGNDWWPAPNMCTADPWGVNDNPFADALDKNMGTELTIKPDKTIDGLPTADEVQAWLSNGDPNNPNPGAKVHIIDVRVAEEQFDGQAPCLTAIHLPTYPVTNSGHPIWKDDIGNWVESYHVPIFAGFYWAGTDIDEGSWQANIRPEPNPNYLALGYQDSSGNNVTLGGYFQALKNQGEINDGDSFVVTCQTGWRGAYAATILKNHPSFKNSKVYDLYGGFRGWNDASGSVDVPGPDSGGVVIDRDANDGNGQCANVTGADAKGNPVVDVNNSFPCDTNKRLRIIPTYEHVNSAAMDPMVNDRWAYNVTRLAKDGQIVMWNGQETHVGQKPEWHTGFGAGDFKLKLSANNARWADYSQRLLSVDYVIKNDPADYMGSKGNQLNYYDECGGAPAPEGNCYPVLHAPWGPAYNVKATGAKPDSGVTVAGVSSPCAPDNPIGSYCAPVPPGGYGVVTVTYQVPTGVTSFEGNPVVTATDIPDPQRSFFGASFDWFFTYTYSHWTPQVTVPKAPVIGIAGL